MALDFKRKVPKGIQAPYSIQGYWSNTGVRKWLIQFRGWNTRNLQSIPAYNRYQRKAKFSEISKLAVYLHSTDLYHQAPKFSAMTSPIEKSLCVIEYAKTNSCTSVQWAFRKRFRTDPHPPSSIQRLFDNFENQGCVWNKKISGRPRVWLGCTAGDGHCQSKSKEMCGEGKPSVTDAENDCVASSAQAGSHATLQCHATKPFDWESWSCRWRVDEVATSLSRSHSMWLLSWSYVKEQLFVPALPLDIDE
jgi:hypothetical protein